MARGYPEVMLLGQTVNAYRYGGHDFAGPAGRACDAVAGLRRLRFTTSHPEPRRRALGARPSATCRRVCPYLHLPVQSGSDRVLAVDAPGLHARASTSTRSRCCGTACPDLALSTDVIVGYPGRDRGRFEETLSTLEAVGFDGLFVVHLLAAARARRALRLADDVPEAEKQRRLQVVNGHQQQWPAAPQRGPRRRRATRSWSTRVDGERPRLRPHAALPHRALRRARLAGSARSVSVEITRSGPNSLQRHAFGN